MQWKQEILVPICLHIHSSDLDEALDILEVADDYKHPLWFDTAQQVRANGQVKQRVLVFPHGFMVMNPAISLPRLLRSISPTASEKMEFWPSAMPGLCMLPDLLEPFKRSSKMHVKTIMVHVNISLDGLFGQRILE